MAAKKSSNQKAPGSKPRATAPKQPATSNTAPPKQLTAEPVDHRIGEAAWGYPLRIGAKWVPNPYDPIRPPKDRLKVMVRSHLCIAALHQVMAIHPTIVGTTAFAEATGMSPSDISRMVTGRRNVTEDTRLLWDKTFGGKRWRPSEAAVDAERDVAWAQIEANPKRVNARSAQAASAKPRKRISSPRLPVASRLAQRLSALATPGLTEALTASYEQCGGIGTPAVEVVIREHIGPRQPVHIANIVSGYVHSDVNDTWIRICLDEGWADRVEAGQPPIVDGVFVYDAEDPDTEGRFGNILGVRAVITTPLDTEPVDWEYRVEAARVEYDRAGDPHIVWEQPDMHRPRRWDR